MKRINLLIVMLVLQLSVCKSQDADVHKLMQDERTQDGIITTIVGSHNLMMKLITAIKKSDHASMMIQHLLSATRTDQGLGNSASEADAHDMDKHNEAKSLYAGEQNREIKSLSPDQIQQYLNGEGMGLAMPAELNHYPGPRHVLDLASELNLTEDQIKSGQAIYDAMHDRAVSLGKAIVEKETSLDKQFSDGNITTHRLENATSEIAVLQGTLRATHLEAHLKMKEILTPAQVKRYDDLRGYGMQ